MISNYVRIAGTAAVCVLLGWLIIRLFGDGFYALSVFIAIAVFFIVQVSVSKNLIHWRWLAPGLVMAMLFTIYPIFYTVYLSFTNMSGGNLLTRSQAVNLISQERYSPEGEIPWSMSVYRKGRDYLLLLNRGNEFSTVKPGSPVEPVNIYGGVPPQNIDGYTLMNRAMVLQNLQTMGEIEFGLFPQTIKIISANEAAVRIPTYTYNERTGFFTDNRDAEIYKPVRGTFISESGNTLAHGFMVNIGWDNYTRFLGNQGYIRPIFGILVWNISFSLFSVLIAFALGLMIALFFDDLKYRKIIRTLLIIPYPIPVLVSIMVWRALLNENMGLVTTILNNIFGDSPRFFTDVGWARFALIMLNVYLSYPYFYVLSSGALRSIPTELYEAASIDGANSFTVVRKIVLPMILRILAPLVIASFCFNFNNFTLIWGFNSGLPPMADAAVPMGYTDLLISFIYRLGFGVSTVPDYGFIAAITVMLFILVALMVFFQIRNVKAIKDIKE
jgi:ABC-type sugar transport system permease subunit